TGAAGTLKSLASRLSKSRCLTKPPDIPRQRQQKIPLQHARPCILHKHIAHGSSEGLVLTQQVVGADTEFAVAVFAQAVADTGIPEQKIRVNAFIEAAVTGVGPFAAEHPFGGGLPVAPETGQLVHIICIEG